MQPIIDIHVHIMPYHMMKPSAMELMRKDRKDYADVERYCADPKAFLAFLDSLGVERAGLINYVAPKIIGFTPEVNDWSAKYCSAAPDRFIAFGGSVLLGGGRGRTRGHHMVARAGRRARGAFRRGLGAGGDLGFVGQRLGGHQRAV